ncbi:MAG: gfo/Idh/MocA family oxidoreductase [Spirulina sp. DLM2.Bin59]|nr:MAG: gfo/Idh/MocA family oxidoreductase [Spirulina sp. DLM2.Bin59]
MKIAFVGCGYVADYYIRALEFHPTLKLVGVTDHNPQRLQKFSDFYSVPRYSSLEEILEKTDVEIILNLTNPRSHFDVSKRCLEAGKHVYSEKPLAMTIDQSKELVNLAASHNLQISSAPCSLLGETAQTLWRAIRENVVGPIRLVYAEMDDGMVHKARYQQWLSRSGTPWPYQDEFEVGCTLEHAGYYVNWLTAFFGPAVSVTAFSACLIPDKETDVTLDPKDTPDFSVACIQFRSGVVARVTCSIVAPHDHALRIIGDQGILSIHECWDYGDPVYVQKLMRIRRKVFLNPIKRRYPLVRKALKVNKRGIQQMDFCRGVAEMAAALRENRPSRMAADVSLHNNELAIAIQNALTTGGSYKMTTSFEPITPMDWALA